MVTIRESFATEDDGVIHGNCVEDIKSELGWQVDVPLPDSAPAEREVLVAPPVNGALGWLLRAVEEARAPARQSTAAGDEILLDTTVGDVRCLLIRQPAENSAAGHARLSPREREIARMVGKGFTNKTIAHVLDISLWTVATHLRRVFAKLDVTTRAAMVARVLEDDRFAADLKAAAVESRQAAARFVATTAHRDVESPTREHRVR